MPTPQGRRPRLPKKTPDFRALPCYSRRRMSGHSKWATIKRTKGKTDAARGKVFTKLIREVTTAARIGGGDVDANPRLRKAVQDCRAQQMPADNISGPSTRYG